MFGYIRSPLDVRDWLLQTTLRNFPESYAVPRFSEVPTLNQGTRGTCVAFSAACIKMWQELQEHGAIEGLSPEYIYQRCKSLDGIPNDEGTYPRVAMRVLRHFGTCSESLFPYHPQPLTVDPPFQADNDAIRNRIKGYSRVRWVVDMKEALMRHGPVLIGVPVYDNWFTSAVNRTGEIPMPEGRIDGGHAMVIYGWRGDRFLVRNSWGVHWGENGNGSIRFDYPALFDDAWLVVDDSTAEILRGEG